MYIPGWQGRRNCTYLFLSCEFWCGEGWDEMIPGSVTDHISFTMSLALSPCRLSLCSLQPSLLHVSCP